MSLTARRALLVLAIAGIGAEAYRLAGDFTVRRYASIKIRWAGTVDAVARGRFERELHLAVPELDEGRTWHYRVYQPTPGRLGPVVRHNRVDDTAYIDRTDFSPERAASDPAPAPLLWVRRAIWMALAVWAVVVSGIGAAVAGLVVKTLRLGWAAVRAGVAVAVGGSRVIVRIAAVLRAVVLRRPRPAQAAIVFGAAFLPLTVWSVALDRPHPEWRNQTIYQRGVRLPAGDEFLSQDPEIIDHDVYYHGHYGWVERARQAEVIFTGNSRAVYAFREEAVDPVFRPLGIRWYSLAFPGGADQFPLELMRRYDVWPKVLVVNVHGFFDRDLTRFGQRAVERSAFDGWKYVHERQASWVVRSSLHELLPHWPAQAVYKRGTQIIYRSVASGSWRWVRPIIEPKPLGDYPVARNPDDPVENAGIEKMVRRGRENAPAFIREVESHGTRVVLVYVPWTDTVAFPAAVAVAESLGRPLIVAWPEGMMGAVGSHMGVEGARRYLAALTPKLLELPEFKALTGATRADSE